MHLVYSTLVAAAVWTVLSPAELFRIATRRSSWEQLAERLGRPRPVPPDGSPRVVVHAVSVGEMAAAEALLPALAEEIPGVRFVLTTGNRDGRAAARALQSARADVLAAPMLPWDRPRALDRWLTGIEPDLFVVLETELWPNLYRACGELAIPLCIANGRIYPADERRYRLARRFFRAVLGHVRWLGVQSEADRRRFLDLGARDDRVEVLGNLKYDVPPGPVAPGADRIDGPGPLLLAASTHDPEEDAVLDALARLRDEIQDLRCVIAPRHPRRARAIGDAARARGMDPVPWSGLTPGRTSAPLVILDEMGRLRGLLSRADVVVVGGSFAPRGGHNVLEPAAAGRAIVVGPHVEHFRAIVDEFLANDALCQVASASDLEPALSRLLRDGGARRAMGLRARQTYLAGGGRARAYARRLADVLSASHATARSSAADRQISERRHVRR